MHNRQDKQFLRTGWLIIILASALRLLYAGGFSIVPDEAYYWQWSRYLALGYHDHPPMIAWVIHLSTTLFGHHAFAVRLPSVICLAIASVYVFLFSHRWFSARTAMLSAVLTQSILAFNAGGIIATPDSPLMAAWAGASYHIARAYDEGKGYQWLLGGLWFGLGMLSKYTMGILAPLVFIFGLLHASPRQQLRRAWPYAGLLVGCLMFLPVILWNIDNGWNTFRHAAHQSGVDQETGLHLTYLMEYIASQAGLLSPIVFLLLLSTWFMPFTKPYRQGPWLLNYLFITSFPVVAGFALLSIHTRVEGNWPGPAYLTAAVLICALLDRAHTNNKDSLEQPFSIKLWPWAVGTSYLLTGIILLHVLWPVIPIPVKLDRIAKETQGWKSLANRAAAMKKTMPDPENTFIFSQSYQTSSELAFYISGNPRTVCINKWRRPNAYEYWFKDADLLGQDAVGVCSASLRNTDRLKEIFEFVAPPERFDVHRTSVLNMDRSSEPPVSSYYLYRAFGFKGGVAWRPPDVSDIRANSVESEVFRVPREKYEKKGNKVKRVRTQ
jgi:4-amino-4-deoxy-L-arabinose transferase-like glycosyltransferase